MASITTSSARLATAQAEHRRQYMDQALCSAWHPGHFLPDRAPAYCLGIFVIRQIAA